jgi:hypothetical protein
VPAPASPRPHHECALPRHAAAAAQIKFDHPVAITGVAVSVPADGQQQQAVVKAWARDLGALSAGRFAPLLAGDNNLTCAAGANAAQAAAAEVRVCVRFVCEQQLAWQGTNPKAVSSVQPHRLITTPLHNPPLLSRAQLFATNHVLVRGRYRSIDLTVYGTNWAAVPGQAALSAEQAGLGDVTGALAAPLALAPAGDDVKQEGQDGGGEGATAAEEAEAAPSPPPLLFDPSTSPAAVPFAALPPQLSALLLGAVLYYRCVQLRLKAIEAQPPGERLRGVMAAADAVLSSLRGDEAPLAAIFSTPAARLLPGGSAPIAPPAWTGGGGGGRGNTAAAALRWDAAAEVDALEMAAAWSELLLSPRTQQPLALEVAVAGLTAGVLLASSPATAAKLLAPVGLRGAWIVRAVRGERGAG